MRSAISAPRAASRATLAASPAWNLKSRYVLAILPEPLNNDRFCTNEVQRDIASMGGQASSGSFEKGSQKARQAGHKGGMVGGRQVADEEEDEDEDF